MRDYVAQYGSWVLTAWGLIGWLLVGRKVRAAFLILVALQGGWVTYALVLGQYGFIAAAVGYSAINAWNWWLWRDRGDVTAAVSSNATEVTCRCERRPLVENWGGDTVTRWERVGLSAECPAHA